VHEGEIDQEKPQREEHHIGLEGDPVGERAGDQRRRNDREHHLIGDMYQQRNARRRRRRRKRNAVQERHVEIADDAAGTAGEAQRITHGEPDDGGPAHRHEGLHHDGQNVPPAHQAAVKERQSRSHQHHQAAAKQHKAGIAGIDIGHRYPHR